MSSKCPKCGEKIKPTYLKQTCPKCGVNMLYYKLDEQLEQDAKKAQMEVDAVNRFTDMLKASTIKTPWLIIRLVLFFTPLASMCLPMFWAGHKNVSLITFVMSIINHGLDFGALLSDKGYFFAVLSMVLIIVLSLVEIICSLFSSTKNGFARNMVAFSINFVVFVAMSLLVALVGGGFVKVGTYVTLAIYLVKLVLHIATSNKKLGKGKAIAVILAFALVSGSTLPFMYKNVESTICLAMEHSNISVVSFNVASAFGTSLEDTDSMQRCSRFADYVGGIFPDFIGTQEMNSFWLEKLQNDLELYDSYGVKRGGDSEEKNSEMNPIFWNKQKYKAIEKGTFWLSQTPNDESKYTYVDADGKDAEAGCNRICTYAVLYGNYTTVIFLNTHLDNSSEEARVFGASLILEKIDELKAKYNCQNVVLTGDFNEGANDDAVKLLSSKLNNTNPKNEGGATYQEWGYRQTGDEPIDFVFTSLKPNDYFVLNNLDNGYISDHYGIYAGINF